MSEYGLSAVLFTENIEKGENICLNDEVTPMSQTKNDSKRETFFVNY